MSLTYKEKVKMSCYASPLVTTVTGEVGISFSLSPTYFHLFIGVSYYIIWKVFESTFQNRLELSVPRSLNEQLDFVFILNLWSYTSINLSQ